MYAQSVPALISKNVGNTLTNYNTWGGIIYNVKAYGAKGDGVTDDSAAIQSAINAAKANKGGAVTFPFATYAISTALRITNDDIVLDGNGSTIMNTTNIADTIQIASALSRWVVRNFILSRNKTAIGGSGIQQLATQAQGRIENVISEKSYFGFLLRSTDSAIVDRCQARYNISHGFALLPDGTNGALQWNFQGTSTSGSNGGDGLRIEAIAPCTGISCGTFERFDTYANSGYGIGVVGLPSCPINGFRLASSFLGNDILGELFLNTYGQDLTVENIFCELSNDHGINITANNRDFVFTNINTNGNKKNGIYCAGNHGVFNSIISNNNGYTSTASADRIGVNLVGDDLFVNSVISSNRSSTYQDIGIKLGGHRNMVTTLISENNVTSQYVITNPSDSFVKDGFASGKMLENRGRYTGTPNTSGIITIPHGLGVVPGVTLVSVESQTFVVAHIWQQGNGTNIFVILYNQAGAAITTGTYSVNWLASA